jgi:polyphenol oxidase
MQARPVFLRQVHGTRVVLLTADDAALQASAQAPLIEADASVTREPGVACTVQVADCLPVLFAAPGGRAVGAAHAGWRGLAGGVLQATLEAVCGLAQCQPSEVAAWLGPCIGPRAFEVGADVLQGFGLDPSARENPHFVPRPEATGPQHKWLADLAGLARGRLAAAGVVHISGGDWCTVEASSRFFSFRRDRVTGRLAAAVWIR